MLTRYQCKQPLGRRWEPELIPGGGEEEEEGGLSRGEGLLLGQANEEEEEEGKKELEELAAGLEAAVLRSEGETSLGATGKPCWCGGVS